jgi:plastocyanin
MPRSSPAESRPKWDRRIARGYLAFAAVLGALVAALPSLASSETSPTVEAVNVGLYTHYWSPSQVAVASGGVVRFSNPTTVAHGVEWRDASKPTCSGEVPVGNTPAASGTNWSGTCTFPQAGTYTFYCTVHGPEMSGTITVSASGTTTMTTGVTPTPTVPTSTTPASEPSSAPPPLERPSLRFSQRGGAVRGSLDVSRTGAGGRLRIGLFAKRAALGRASGPSHVRVGQLVRSSVPAGRFSFRVKLDASARRALRRHRRLALSVRITLTPTEGEPLTLTRAVVEHP